MSPSISTLPNSQLIRVRSGSVTQKMKFRIGSLETVREVAGNFGGITEMRDEYFELQREIYR